MEHVLFQPSWALDWLLESTIYISILICLIFVIKTVVKGKFPAWWVYGLWLLLLLRMMMPWDVESRMSIYNFLPAPLENETHIPFLLENDLSLSLTKGNLETAGIIADPASKDTNLFKESVNQYNNYNSKESTGYNIKLSLGNAFLILWLAGVMFFGIKTLSKNMMFWLAIRKLPLVKDKVFLELFEECRTSMAVQKNIAVIVTDRVRSPALFGYFKPRLLLPLYFIDALQRDELRYVFLHELSHLKRHDIAISWLVAVLQVIHWFNPLVWYAFYHLRIDQEAACDAYLLSRINQAQPAHYANTIVSLLESFIQNRQLPSLAGIIENKSQIRKRIFMIMSFKRYTMQMKCASVLMFFMVGLIFFTVSSGKADVKKQKDNSDNEEMQLSVPLDQQALTVNENKSSTPANENQHYEAAHIVQHEETLKQPAAKEDIEINPVRVETEKVEIQANHLLLTADKQKETLSENNVTVIEEPEQGIKLVETVQQQQDSSIDFTSLGLSCLEKGQIYDAVSNFNRAIELNPGNSVAYFSRGRAYFKHGKIKNAISDYNKAIEISPEFTEAYKNRGYAYYYEGKVDKSVTDYGNAIGLNSEDAATYNMRGVAYFKQGKIKKAVSDYSKAIEINPEFAASYLNRGYSYHTIQDYNNAISDYTRAIDINPEFTAAYLARAHSYQSEKNYDRAISDYDRAIELNPENVQTYISRGLLYSFKNENEKAIADYDQAIKLNPGNAYAYYARGLVYSSERKFKKARSEFDKVIELNPDADLAKLAKKYRKSAIRGDFVSFIPVGYRGENIDHNDMGTKIQNMRSIGDAAVAKAAAGK